MRYLDVLAVSAIVSVLFGLSIYLFCQKQVDMNSLIIIAFMVMAFSLVVVYLNEKRLGKKSRKRKK